MAKYDLSAPMAPATFFHDILYPAFEMLPEKMNKPEAVVQLIAIAYQESNFQFRIQQPNGPAKGFWQFESGGGVKGVMEHLASTDHAKEICAKLAIPFVRKTVYDELEKNDVLACAFARLLLWTDPNPLPRIDDFVNMSKPTDSASWNYYARNWRPGKPHPEKWFLNRRRAQEALAQVL